MALHSPPGLLQLVLTFSFLATAQKLCYFPNGEIDYDSTPCAPTNATSSCCGPYPGFLCLSNGLCLSALEGIAKRVSCTDKNWGDGCAVTCKDYDNSTYANVQACNLQGVQHCCGGASCCDSNPSEPFAPAFFADQRVSTISVAAITATITQTTKAMQTATVTATSTSPATSHNTSNGREAAIGAGIGIPLGIALVAALVLLWRERTRSRVLREDAGNRHAQGGHGKEVYHQVSNTEVGEGFETSSNRTRPRFEAGGTSRAEVP